jgi:hypothetical protein
MLAGGAAAVLHAAACGCMRRARHPRPYDAMESEHATTPATAPDGTTEPPVRKPPTTVALVPVPGPAPVPPARSSVDLGEWLLAAPLGATKTLLDLTDAAADRLAELLGLRPPVP